MERSEIEARVVRLLARQRGIDPGGIQPEARLEEDLGLDSLGMLDLIFSLEESFGVSIPDETAGAITTVAGAVDTVARLMGRG